MLVSVAATVAASEGFLAPALVLVRAAATVAALEGFLALDGWLSPRALVSPPSPGLRERRCRTLRAAWPSLRRCLLPGVGPCPSLLAVAGIVPVAFTPVPWDGWAFNADSWAVGCEVGSAAAFARVCDG